MYFAPICTDDQGVFLSLLLHIKRNTSSFLTRGFLGWEDCNVDPGRTRFCFMINKSVVVVVFIVCDFVQQRPVALKRSSPRTEVEEVSVFRTVP